MQRNQRSPGAATHDFIVLSAPPPDPHFPVSGGSGLTLVCKTCKRAHRLCSSERTAQTGDNLSPRLDRGKDRGSCFILSRPPVPPFSAPHPAIESTEARILTTKAGTGFCTAERQRAGMGQLACLFPAPTKFCATAGRERKFLETLVSKPVFGCFCLVTKEALPGAEQPTPADGTNQNGFPRRCAHWLGMTERPIFYVRKTVTSWPNSPP